MPNFRQRWPVSRQTRLADHDVSGAWRDGSLTRELFRFLRLVPLTFQSAWQRFVVGAPVVNGQKQAERVGESGVDLGAIADGQ